MSYSTAKFPSKLNSEQKIVSEMGPRSSADMVPGTWFNVLAKLDRWILVFIYSEF